MRQQRNKQMPRGIAGFLIACLWAMLLAACGGGGGSPGVNPYKPSDSATGTDKVASIVITTSSDSMPSSGTVTVNVLAKDANNNVVPDAILNITVDKGASLSRTNVDRKTDKNGLITETLSSPGDATERVVTISASGGSAPVAQKTVTIKALKPTLTLTVSSSTLDSSGADGSEVVVSAIVRDAGNNVMPNVQVFLEASSGSLSNTNRITDANGRVTEKLSIGGDRSKRDITVSARTDTIELKSQVVTVQGHKFQFGTIESANLGEITKMSVFLLDSANKPMSGVKVKFKAQNNPEGLTETGSGVKGEATTDTQGQIKLDYKPTSGTVDSLTFEALGLIESRAITINTLQFTITAFNAGGTATTSSFINTCVPFKTHVAKSGTPQAGQVSLSSTRGVVYKMNANKTCTEVLSSALTLNASGDAEALIQADTPGVATLVASFKGPAPDNLSGVANTELEFTAPVESTSYVVLQVDPTVVAPGKTATIRALVRDGTAKDNLVKDAQLSFSIKEDPSGGRLAQPTVVRTDADGTASVVYTAGTVTTKVDGVVLQARILSKDKNNNDLPVVTGKNPAEAKLTVSGQALFISAGTGSTILTPNSASYAVDYVVVVTDATGNPVSNATITAKVVPSLYRKGILTYDLVNKFWRLPDGYNECQNEDKNRNGVLDADEDYNLNGRLDPGIPITIGGKLTTDATGTGLVQILYPRDRAKWTVVDITITARVAGTEAKYVAGLIELPGLNDDYKEQTKTPPGLNSPYGTRVEANNDLGCKYAN